jgi:hypothetical protein
MTHESSPVCPRRKFAFVFSLLFCLLFVLHVAAQDQPANPPLGRNPLNSGDPAWEAQQKREAERKENVKRQQDLKKDTDRLLQLATELKQYVEKTNENTLSVDVIKKADEIERLSKTIKDKMKGP